MSKHCSTCGESPTKFWPQDSDDRSVAIFVPAVIGIVATMVVALANGWGEAPNTCPEPQLRATVDEILEDLSEETGSETISDQTTPLLEDSQSPDSDSTDTQSSELDPSSSSSESPATQSVSSAELVSFAPGGLIMGPTAPFEFITGDCEHNLNEPSDEDFTEILPFTPEQITAFADVHTPEEHVHEDCNSNWSVVIACICSALAATGIFAFFHIV